jgi:hypothetical protein
LLTIALARRAGTALFAASLAASLTGCGGGSSAAKASAINSNPSTTSTTAATAASRTAFRQCMASHGITLPSRPTSMTGPSSPPSSRPADESGGTGGGFGGGFGGRFQQPPPGVDPTAYQNALNACRSLLPTGGANGAQFRTAYMAYINCLRNHGVTTGDPSQLQQALANVDRTSPTFVAANQQCRALLPQRGTTTTTTVGA